MRWLLTEIRILGMKDALSVTLQFAVIIVCLLAAVANARAQGATGASAPENGVVLIKLYPPIYPPLARQAVISGNVEVELAIRKDGSVESAVVISGHPMLKQAALDSAQKSQFECRRCDGLVSSYTLTFAFELRDDSDCCNAWSHSETVSESLGHITISAPHGCLCDPTASVTRIKWRSAKCLYLWRCGSRVIDSR
jgi:TonB family protein